MKPYVPLTAASPTTNEAVASIAGLLNEVQTKFPKMNVLSVAVSPEIQPPSFGSPNGKMIYVAVALVQMDNEDDYNDLVEFSKTFSPGPRLHLVK